MFNSINEIQEQKIFINKQASDSTNETIFLPKKLEDAKLEIAGLNAKYFEKLGELKELNEKIAQIEKENMDYKKKLSEFYSIKKIKKHENNENKQDPQSQEEINIFITEEIKQFITEIIFVYKTLDTNAKELKEIYELKKERAENLRNIAVTFEHKKNKEKVAILKDLENDFGFIKAIGPSEKNTKILASCLMETINIKLCKHNFYENQLMKFNQMSTVAKQKIVEYNQKLCLF